MSRHGEKEQMIHLNDRLAKYIERVRALETENKRLDVHIKEIETVENRERKNLVASYEKELAELRRLLDETAKRRAELQIANDRISAEHDDLVNRLKKAETELERALRDLHSEQSINQNLSTRNATLESDNRRLLEENKKQKKDLADAFKEKELAKKQLEEETVMRVDTENRLQSLKEQMKFNQAIHEQAVQEMKERRETEINVATRGLQDEFHSRLQEELDSVRAMLEKNFDAQRRQLENLYQQKLASASKSSSDAREEMLRAREDATSFRMQVEVLERERSTHEAALESLKRDLQRARDALSAAHRDYDERLARRDDELAAVRSEIDRMMSEYQDLMEIKVKLDMEINAYRALLEEEETRLNLTASPQRASTLMTSARGAKRRRVALELGADDEGAENEAHSDATRHWERETKRFHTKEWSELSGVSIEHDHASGNWVRIVNNSDDDVPLNGFVLKQSSGGHCIQYKFHQRAKLASKASVTVWSTNADGAAHNPPTDLMMKQSNWPCGGDKTRAFLINSDEHEVAWRESEATFGTGFENGAEFANGTDQRCSIM